MRILKELERLTGFKANMVERSDDPVFEIYLSYEINRNDLHKKGEIFVLEDFAERFEKSEIYKGFTEPKDLKIKELEGRIAEKDGVICELNKYKAHFDVEMKLRGRLPIKDDPAH